MIPEKYIGGQRQIASYDFTDIAEGTGVVDFYGISENLSGSTLYALTKNSIYSADIQSAGTSWTFNLSAFNLPKIIKGTAIIRFSAALTGNQNNTMNFDVAIQKVSDGTASAIGSASTATLTLPANGTTAKNYTIPISCTQTHFKIGDNLRIVFTGHNGGTTINLGHDPANRDTPEMTAATNPTKMECFIPFRIDA